MNAVVRHPQNKLAETPNAGTDEIQGKPLGITFRCEIRLIERRQSYPKQRGNAGSRGWCMYDRDSGGKPLERRGRLPFYQDDVWGIYPAPVIVQLTRHTRVVPSLLHHRRSFATKLHYRLYTHIRILVCFNRLPSSLKLSVYPDQTPLLRVGAFSHLAVSKDNQWLHYHANERWPLRLSLLGIPNTTNLRYQSIILQWRIESLSS